MPADPEQPKRPDSEGVDLDALIAARAAYAIGGIVGLVPKRECAAFDAGWNAALATLPASQAVYAQGLAEGREQERADVVRDAERYRKLRGQAVTPTSSLMALAFGTLDAFTDALPNPVTNG